VSICYLSLSCFIPYILSIIIQCHDYSCHLTITCVVLLVCFHTYSVQICHFVSIFSMDIRRNVAIFSIFMRSGMSLLTSIKLLWLKWS